MLLKEAYEPTEDEHTVIVKKIIYLNQEKRYVSEKIEKLTITKDYLERLIMDILFKSLKSMKLSDTRDRYYELSSVKI